MFSGIVCVAGCSADRECVPSNTTQCWACGEGKKVAAQVGFIDGGECVYVCALVAGDALSSCWPMADALQGVSSGAAGAAKIGTPFSAKLGAKNGAPAREYFFQLTRTSKTSGSYTTIMEEECAKIGMKPLCDHPSYCKNNDKSIYIGQTEHVAHKPHRDDNNRYPSGWSAVKARFPQSFCTYTVNHGGHEKALCTTGGGHAWHTPSQNPNIMCASLTSPGPQGESQQPGPVTVHLQMMCAAALI